MLLFNARGFNQSTIVIIFKPEIIENNPSKMLTLIPIYTRGSTTKTLSFVVDANHGHVCTILNYFPLNVLTFD
jgi:hypothetical protein